MYEVRVYSEYIICMHIFGSIVEYSPSCHAVAYEIIIMNGVVRVFKYAATGRMDGLSGHHHHQCRSSFTLCIYVYEMNVYLNI